MKCEDLQWNGLRQNKQPDYGALQHIRYKFFVSAAGLKKQDAWELYGLFQRGRPSPKTEDTKTHGLPPKISKRISEQEDKREAVDIAVLNAEIERIVSRSDVLRNEIAAIISEIEGAEI